ncbi:MAG: undecaprenyl-diphosphate phosphatase [Acidobacteria bacterium]|nr:undecaprenyl-diphosphate phosphatase [Acidobacteriota bacterium]
MNLIHAIFLGLIQGLTEFLPVSSTAHLSLAEHLMLGRGMPLAFDVLLHGGTLLALTVYFRTELRRVALGILGRDAQGRRLASWLLVAMLPTGVFAMATRHLKEISKEHLWVYGLGLILTAGLLAGANRRASARPGRPVEELGTWDALAVGTIQGLGGGFGLSRSGSTIAMGVFRGLALPASARFSFLLGIPTIAAAALVEARPLLKALLMGRPLTGELAFPPGSASPALLCGAGVAVAAISGYLAIGLLDRFTRRPRLMGFAAYCAGAGALMLGLGLLGTR